MTVRVPPRWLASDGSTVTHTLLPAAARSVGSFPRRTSCVAPVAGSILDTAPLTLSATQTAPLAYTTPAGAPPTLIVCTLPVRGSKRVTAPPVSAAQMLPAPTATPAGPCPIAIARDGRSSPGSTRSSSPVSWLTTQTAPAPTAMPVGALPRGMTDTTSPVAALILDRVSLVTLATQTDPYPDAMTLGPIPTVITPTCVPAPGLTSETVPSSWLATQTRPSATVTPAGPRPTAIRSMTCPAESTRSRRSSALSVIQTAPAPETIPFGRPTPVTTALRLSCPPSITPMVFGPAARCARPPPATTTRSAIDSASAPTTASSRFPPIRTDRRGVPRSATESNAPAVPAAGRPDLLPATRLSAWLAPVIGGGASEGSCSRIPR